MRTAFALAIACSRPAEPAPKPAPAAPVAATSAPAPAPAARAPLPPLTGPFPGARRALAFAGDALRVAVADVDGDGKGEIVFGDDAKLRVVRSDGRAVAEIATPGGLQVLAAADLDGDRRAELLCGFGRTAKHAEEHTRIGVFDLKGGALVEQVVAEPASARAEVTALVPSGGDLLAAWFESKYVVHAATAHRAGGAWSLLDVASLRMAMSWARGDVDGDGAPDTIVGRLYGDAQGVDGDAFWLGPGGARAPIPTVRGVRGLAVADTDGDGRAEVFLGDGWSQKYADEGRGRLSWARWDGAEFHSDLIEDTAGQYTLWRIVPADLDGDGRPEIVTLGSHYVRVFKRAGNAWKGLTVAGQVRDLAAGDLDGKPGSEIVVVGDPSESIALSAADWK